MKLIRIFVEHRLAANLAMVLMILAGVWAVSQITVRLNPEGNRHFVNTSIAWRGASAEDVEKLVTTPVEQHIKTIPEVKTMWSVTRDGYSFVRIELEPDAHVQTAVDAVQQRVAQLRSLPPEIEPPSVFAVRQQDLVAAVLVTGAGHLGELIPLARQMQDELLTRGVDAVQFRGLPEQEIAIQVEGRTLLELGLTFDELAARLAALSNDAPGGAIGSGQLSRQLRSLDQRRAPEEFAALPVHTGRGLVRLGDIARIERRPVVDQPYMTVAGQPAIALFVRREAASDSLDAARNLSSYLEAKRPTLPAGVSLNLFLEAWRFISDELGLILRNGLTGLALVIVTLALFLRPGPAFWVTMGIPATFLAALLGFYWLGGSLNAVSLIGLVMALGIVVDDAIVVGEESVTQFHAGELPAMAAATGAERMFGPVIASSLTTLAAFIPLATLDDSSVREIAVIVAVVIGASLVECFLVLPGHLRHAFERGQVGTSRWRARFEAGFERFRDQRFRRFVRYAMANRSVVLTGAVGMFVVTLLMWTTGWIKTELNLNLDFEEVRADLRFVPGADEASKQAFLAHLEEALAAADEAAGGGNLVNHLVTRNAARTDGEYKTGAQFASVQVELVSAERRDFSADRFAAQWLSHVERSPAVDALAIARERSWLSHFSILLKGEDAATLKRAGDAAVRELMALDGVSNVRDNAPWGNDQWLLRLTTAGRALGLSTADLGRQLRSAYDGRRIQIFQEGDSELEVRLLLPEAQRSDLAGIGEFPIKAPTGEMLPLASVATVEARRGIDAIRHHNGERTLTIRGDVDVGTITGGEVVNYFNENVRERLVAEYRISTGLDELSLAEAEAATEFMLKFGVALALIYVVLAWCFASWSWPLAVMAAIPLGLTGALLGHAALGMHINPMSLLGLFTLTGIIINDSIILVSAYKRRVAEGASPSQAIEDAVCRRLRPVLLTSVTTIAGLAPLMLEQAPIAAMFTPLAAAICFGLLYGTVLVLIVIPVLLSVLIDWGAKLRGVTGAARMRFASRSRRAGAEGLV